MIDFTKLNKIIHERGRLAIMTLLATRPEWRFSDLKSELRMSDGNLITHLRTLENAGYIRVEKGGDAARKPVSVYRMSDGGRDAYANYLSVLEAIVSRGQDGRPEEPG